LCARPRCRQPRGARWNSARAETRWRDEARGETPEVPRYVVSLPSAYLLSDLPTFLSSPRPPQPLRAATAFLALAFWLVVPVREVVVLIPEPLHWWLPLPTHRVIALSCSCGSLRGFFFGLLVRELNMPGQMDSTGLAVGLKKGFIVEKRKLAPKPASRKGVRAPASRGGPRSRVPPRCVSPRASRDVQPSVPGPWWHELGGGRSQGERALERGSRAVGCIVGARRLPAAREGGPALPPCALLVGSSRARKRARGDTRGSWGQRAWAARFVSGRRSYGTALAYESSPRQIEAAAALSRERGLQAGERLRESLWNLVRVRNGGFIGGTGDMGTQADVSPVSGAVPSAASLRPPGGHMQHVGWRRACSLGRDTVRSAQCG